MGTTTNSSNKWLTPDLFVTSFLIIKGHTPEYIRQGRRINFNFPASDKLFQDLTLYSSGEKIPASQFAQTVKQLKATVLSMRDDGDGYGNGYSRQRR